MNLEPARIRLFRNGDGLWVVIDDTLQPVSRLASAFPRTSPDLFIGLLGPDGHEIGMIQDPAGLDPTSRDLLQAELKARYFIPTIQEILSVEHKGTGYLWNTVTDDGERSFRIKDRDALNGSDPPTIQISDDNGRRFQIPNYWALPDESRELIQHLLPDKIVRAHYARFTFSMHGSGRGGGKSSGRGSSGRGGGGSMGGMVMGFR